MMTEHYTYDPVSPLRKQLEDTQRILEKVQRERDELKAWKEAVPIGAIDLIAGVASGRSAQKVQEWLEDIAQ
jgi:hypothetical protein